MLGWLMIEKIKRLLKPNSSTVSAPPSVACTAEAGSSGLRWISPATIACRTCAVPGTFVNSTSSPCSPNIPDSNATHMGACVALGTVQLRMTRRGGPALLAVTPPLGPRVLVLLPGSAAAEGLGGVFALQAARSSSPRMQSARVPNWGLWRGLSRTCLRSVAPRVVLTWCLSRRLVQAWDELPALQLAAHNPRPFDHRAKLRHADPVRRGTQATVGADPQLLGRYIPQRGADAFCDEFWRFDHVRFLVNDADD